MIERLITIFFLVMVIIYTENALSLSFGSFMAPKAGFLPVIAGCIAIALTLVLITRLLSQKGSKINIYWRKLFFLIIGILVYIMLLKLVGYIAAVFISLVYLLKVTETAGWMYLCLFSAGIAVSFYFLFAKLLGSNLP